MTISQPKADIHVECHCGKDWRRCSVCGGWVGVPLTMLPSGPGPEYWVATVLLCLFWLVMGFALGRTLL